MRPNCLIYLHSSLSNDILHDYTYQIYSPRIFCKISWWPPGPMGRLFWRKLQARTQNYGPLAPGPAPVSTPAVLNTIFRGLSFRLFQFSACCIDNRLFMGYILMFIMWHYQLAKRRWCANASFNTLIVYAWYVVCINQPNNKPLKSGDVSFS